MRVKTPCPIRDIPARKMKAKKERIAIVITVSSLLGGVESVVLHDVLDRQR